jgi:hypothetical protein
VKRIEQPRDHPDDDGPLLYVTKASFPGSNGSYKVIFLQVAFRFFVLLYLE